MVTERNLDGETITRPYRKNLTEQELYRKLCELEHENANLDLNITLLRMDLYPFINLCKDYNLTLDDLYEILIDTLEKEDKDG